MSAPVVYQLLADAILLLHLIFVAFVVLGFGLIAIGLWAKWAWVHNRIFRITHLLAIAVVVVQAWLGRDCPLTVWENRLREMAGQTSYTQSFVEYWLQKILFYRAESWVFTTLYTIFGVLVLVLWLATVRKEYTAGDRRQDPKDE